MLARVCAERSVFGFEASFISSRKNSFLSGGVVAGKEHRVKVPYAYRFFFLAANGLSNCPRTAHIVSVAKRRKTMNERPEIVCATCGTDEKALYDAVAKVIEQYKEKEGSLIMVLHAAAGVHRRRHGPACVRGQRRGKFLLFLLHAKERKAHDSDVPGNCLLCQRRQKSCGCHQA